MPGFDGSGPYGDGPQGRGFGPCNGNRSDMRYGRGFGRRGWSGRGWFGRGRNASYYSPQEEIVDLEREKSFLEKRLEDIKQLLNKKEEE
jgi:hypothetical protein